MSDVNRGLSPISARIMALCPGFTATNFMSTANGDATGIPLARPEMVAESCLKAFVQGKRYHVPGIANYLVSLLPRISSRAMVIRSVAGMFKNRVTRGQHDVSECPINVRDEQTQFSEI